MNVLTFDIEEWFHLLDNASTKSEKQWSNYESRIHKNMETIYQILDKTNGKASFFVMGWIAQKYPEVVREIVNRGYEIGSHTHLHQLVYEQKREEFKEDVGRSIKTLEDISGKKVQIFRAPGFSITEKNKWAFEVLFELGIKTDSSVFPAGRSHGGMPSYGIAQPSVLQYNGIELREFPINTHTILGQTFIYSGGGYFRLTPYSYLKKWTAKHPYVMSYIHPRDLDPKQPTIKELSFPRRFKSYVGLKYSKQKLEKWLTDFEFMDIETAEKKIDWTETRKIKL